MRVNGKDFSQYYWNFDFGIFDFSSPFNTGGNNALNVVFLGQDSRFGIQFLDFDFWIWDLFLIAPATAATGAARGTTIRI